MFTFTQCFLLLTLVVVGQSKMHIENFQEKGINPPTDEEREARNDRGHGKPRRFREENNVLVLTDANFGVAIEQYDFLLVQFYAPWCGHCKKLAPEYSGAATALYDEQDIQLGKVDCTTSKKLHNRYKIEGFPTMYFFKYGKQVPYTGGNTKDSILQWVQRHSQPSTTALTSIAALEAKQEMVPVMLVGYFPSVGDSTAVQAAQKAFFQAAETKDYLNFFHTESRDVAKHLGLMSDGITILKTFDEKQHNFIIADLEEEEGSSVAAEVHEFVTKLTYPLVSVFTKEKAREIFAPKIMTHVLVFTDPSTDHHEPALATAANIATQFRGAAQVISITATDDAILTHFKVDQGSLPSVVVMDVDLMERFPFPASDEENEGQGERATALPFHAAEQYDRLAEHVQAVIDRDF